MRPPTHTEIRDKTIEEVAKIKAHLPRDNTQDAHLNTYIDFPIEHINTDPRGHRIWLGNLDASAIQYIHTHAPTLQTAILNPNKIKKIHATL